MDRRADRIIIVDANTHIRRLIATLLGAMSAVDVAEARDTVQGARILKDGGADLIILDWAADSTEAAAFAHDLRHGALGDPTVPVLALATSTHHAVLEAAWAAGIDEVLSKPISAIDVIHHAGALLKGRARACSAPTDALAAE